MPQPTYTASNRRISMSTESTPQEQAALAWMARRHSGRWSARDEQDWQAWMDADPGHAAAWLRVQRVWDELGGLAGVTETKLRPACPARAGHGWRWAAVLAGAAALLMVWLALPPGSFAPAHIVRTALGEQRELMLADRLYARAQHRQRRESRLRPVLPLHQRAVGRGVLQGGARRSSHLSCQRRQLQGVRHRHRLRRARRR